MDTQRAGYMTLEELEQIVNRMVNARMGFIERTRLNELTGKRDSRTVAEFFKRLEVAVVQSPQAPPQHTKLGCQKIWVNHQPRYRIYLGRRTDPFY